MHLFWKKHVDAANFPQFWMALSLNNIVFKDFLVDTDLCVPTELNICSMMFLGKSPVAPR